MAHYICSREFEHSVFCLLVFPVHGADTGSVGKLHLYAGIRAREHEKHGTVPPRKC